MLAQVEAGGLECVIVKDLSRFGRDYIGVGSYLERVFPAKGVRFIAICDGIDSGRGAYDMMLPLKSIFNAQYAKDVSQKVRGAFRAKQQRGEFCGAFAAYGYRKDPLDKNHLLVDPAAAEIVRGIFELAAGGAGRQEIADKLNAAAVASPGEYKRLTGSGYRNGGQDGMPRRWTYAAVNKVLGNEVYIGNMVSNRSARVTMHGKMRANAREDWIVAEGTHEAIISRELWDTVQAQSRKRSRTGSVFTGFLHCGDCGSPMTRTTWSGQTMYCCGNYHRRGTAACSAHYIAESLLEESVRGDVNRVIRRAADLKGIAARQSLPGTGEALWEGERKQLSEAVERVRKLKKGVYEDYRDGLLDKEEHLRYRADYVEREKALLARLKRMESGVQPGARDGVWVERLVRTGRLEALDRAVIAQNIRDIRVFADGHVEITYLFAKDAYVTTNNA